MKDLNQKQIDCNEIWKTAKSFPNYEVSNLGTIRNKLTLKNLSKNALRGGYIRIDLRNSNGKQKKNSLHRVVAEAFIPNPEKKKTVNHKNHDKLDNRVDNLDLQNKTNIEEKFHEKNNDLFHQGKYGE
jgi:hypothetical protein